MALDINGIFKSVDRMDAAGFASYFTEDGLFTFGNWPTVKGRDEITGSVDGFFESIKALEHRVIDRWTDEGAEIVEVEVTYTRHDGSPVDLTAACIFRVREDLISDYRIYMDISPLNAES
jgi:uncharacterized protein (TIGR02246 family)